MEVIGMRFVRKIKNGIKKAIVSIAPIASAVAVYAEEAGSAIDLSVLTSILTAILPVFLLIAVLKMLFSAFRDWT